MAPPRQQRTTTVADDSRSEASSGTREPKMTTGKGRKAANGTNSSSRADGKAAVNVTSAPAQQQQPADDLPNIPWSDMPLEILHAYRHAYNIPIPSAYSKSYSHVLLSQGIGLRSPTSIAVQRSQDSASSTSSASASSAIKKNGTNGIRNHHNRKHHNNNAGFDDRLHLIGGQSRVSKDQLALAVRKHFNSAGLAEQETIARFLYKVREEGKGRQFRLRFQP